ncbi:MAG: bifunctional 3,4-dihydroxy-2-butanone-4-phosphate synthase/GTP cyclohydrolase II [Burkholderiales bacterium]|jgi:3,4-dihydroxy 2-butanone 4-phosphate synthase/GTP cyclohydrolase II|nr:bifunctional 3,4-dihydroxy-2-butanone-4-phosphate synthase/GTP cyclohydrolase II [Burkholderiales bacterium]
MPLSPIPEIIAELKAGHMVVVVDDEDRENEGDLVMAAEFVTPEAINFMAKHGRGLICLTLTEQRCRQLNLPLMVRDNRAPLGTAFTMSIEAASGVTTGISAHDRARTIQAAVAPAARPEDLVQPGHVFPLMAQPGGVLLRAGHTEAGCDLANLAGLQPAAVICEILKDDGSMARLPDLVAFAREHGLKIGSIADLIHFRSRNESLVRRITEREIQTAHGPFRLIAYIEKPSGTAHLALVRGEPDPHTETLVRVHEPLSVLDLLEAAATTHSWSVEEALAAIAAAGKGVIVLLNCAESGGDLIERVASAAKPRVPAKNDLLTYGIGAQILRDLDVRRMKLMANPRKMPSMAGWELEVTGYIQPTTRSNA